MPLFFQLKENQSSASSTPINPVLKKGVIKKIETTRATQARKKATSTLVGLGTGYLGSHIYQTTGAAVALHEVVGHGLLGLGLTAHYNEGHGPTYWIAGFDQWHQVEHAHNATEGTQAFFTWLFIPQSKDGAAGTTSHEQGQPNALGNHLGPEGTQAWVSIAGSIPGLVVNASCVATGMFLRKKHPGLALGLMSFGLVNSLSEGAYAWDAAFMSPQALQKNAAHGHDFANFALQMSRITGLSASLIAISTALFWTGIIPVMMLGIYFYQASHQLDIVPDELAVQHWLSTLNEQENQTLFMQLLNQYLSDYALENDEFNLLNEADFLLYLQKNLPKKNMEEAKRALLEQWRALQNPSNLQRGLAYASLATVVLSVAIQIMDLLANTITPCLLTAVIVLKSILPVLGIISIAHGVYETYHDVQSASLSLLAKSLSGLKLCITTTMVALLMAATFAPGMAFLFLPAVILGSILTLGLSFAKMKATQHCFQETPPLIENKDTYVMLDNEGEVSLSI